MCVGGGGVNRTRKLKNISFIRIVVTVQSKTCLTTSPCYATNEFLKI